MAIAAVRRYCEARIPPEHLDEVRVEFAVRGRSVSIYECRAPWDDDFGPEWTRRRVAQLRYDRGDGRWRLHWSDRNGRWHPYDMSEPTAHVRELLTEIDADPTGIFWG
jgi:hypothetical protein